jgi:hypothetical protein
MTLTHGRFISYEYDRMVVLFSMLDGNKEIPCAVSTSAPWMTWKVWCERKRASARLQFMRLRECIEACANGKYQATEFEGPPPGIVLRSIDFPKAAIKRAGSRHIGKCCRQG